MGLSAQEKYYWSISIKIKKYAEECVVPIVAVYPDPEVCLVRDTLEIALSNSCFIPISGSGKESPNVIQTIDTMI